MARRAREDVAKVAGTDFHVRPADAAGEDLDEDLVGGRVLQGHILDGEARVWRRENDGFVGFGEGACHFSEGSIGPGIAIGFSDGVFVISLFAVNVWIGKLC